MNDESILLAEKFAREKHKNQKYNWWKNWNYIDDHLIPVMKEAIDITADICNWNINEEMKRVISITALLHDIYEDTDCSYELLEKKFWKSIADNVITLSICELNKKDKKEKSLYYKKISENLITTIVKIADRRVNLKLLSQLKDEKFKAKLTNKYKEDMYYFQEYKMYPFLLESLINRN